MQTTEADSLIQLGMGIAIIGIIILVLAILLIVLPHLRRGKTKVAGVVIVGPVPIIFGSDKQAVRTVLVLSIVLTALLIALGLLYYFLFR